VVSGLKQLDVNAEVRGTIKSPKLSVASKRLTGGLAPEIKLPKIKL
jgi:hypothetical protein